MLDSSGNLYASYALGFSNGGIEKFSPTGVLLGTFTA
jgi:hypothetical protein